LLIQGFFDCISNGHTKRDLFYEIGRLLGVACAKIKMAIIPGIRG
jgi:hypothetical protein